MDRSLPPEDHRCELSPSLEPDLGLADLVLDLAIVSQPKRPRLQGPNTQAFEDRAGNTREARAGVDESINGLEAAVLHVPNLESYVKRSHQVGL